MVLVRQDVWRRLMGHCLGYICRIHTTTVVCSEIQPLIAHTTSTECTGLHTNVTSAYALWVTVSLAVNEWPLVGMTNENPSMQGQSTYQWLALVV